MNPYPVQMLDPVFRFLDAPIFNSGQLRYAGSSYAIIPL